MPIDIRKNTIIVISICVIMTIFLGVLIVGASSNKTTRILTEQTEEDIKFNDEKLNIYFFYGKGCSHCEELISFLNSLPSEYNDYYDLYTLEVWYNDKNNELMNNLVQTLDKTVEGIPCLIIGDQVFFGYSTRMDEKLKKAIKEEYKERKQFDVYKEYKN